MACTALSARSLTAVVARARILGSSVRLYEHVEGLGQFVIRHSVAVHVQAREERSVEDGAYFLVALLIEAGRVLKQVERQVEDLTTGFKLLLGLFETAPNTALLNPNGVDLLPQLVLGPVFFCRQVKEVRLFLIELGEPLTEPFSPDGGGR